MPYLHFHCILLRRMCVKKFPMPLKFNTCDHNLILNKVFKIKHSPHSFDIYVLDKQKMLTEFL